MRIAHTFTFLVVVSVVAGCVTGAHAELDQLNDQVRFIAVGETTRQAVTAEYGKPTSTYENGAIVVYVFETMESGPISQHRLTPESNGPQLVVEYDEADHVIRYSTLVPP